MSRAAKITIPVSIGYGLTDIMEWRCIAVIGAWLLLLYTTFVGLSPVEAALRVAITACRCHCQSVCKFHRSFFKNYFGKVRSSKRFFFTDQPLMLVYALQSPMA